MGAEDVNTSQMFLKEAQSRIAEPKTIVCRLWAGTLLSFAMSVLEHSNKKKQLKREQKRLKEERTRREGRSLKWSERLSLPSWSLLFKEKQPATNAKIPPSDVIGNTSKSTLTASLHEPDELSTVSSLQTLVDK